MRTEDLARGKQQRMQKSKYPNILLEQNNSHNILWEKINYRFLKSPWLSVEKISFSSFEVVWISLHPPESTRVLVTSMFLVRGTQVSPPPTPSEQMQKYMLRWCKVEKRSYLFPEAMLTFHWAFRKTFHLKAFKGGHQISHCFFLHAVCIRRVEACGLMPLEQRWVVF